VGNKGSLCCDCTEPFLGLKSKPGGQAATKDDAMMEPSTGARNVISVGPFRLDPSRRLVDTLVELGGRTLDILIELVSRPNEVVSKNDPLERMWPDVTVDGDSLPFYIVSLRKALFDGKDGARYIAALRRRGGCFIANDRVGEISAAARFPYPNLPAHLIGMFRGERGRRV
jgi:DNA-binding winged helix-turn-helix (wHTH) protein